MGSERMTYEYERIYNKKYNRKRIKISKNRAKSLTNTICTWDALNTQKENMKAVIEKGRDYCVALKWNQGNFHTDVQEYFDEDKLLVIESGYEGSYSLTREKSHNQIITYEYYQTEKVKWYFEKEKWEKLRSIGMVKKTIEKLDGKKVIEKNTIYQVY